MPALHSSVMARQGQLQSCEGQSDRHDPRALAVADNCGLEDERQQISPFSHCSSPTDAVGMPRLLSDTGEQFGSRKRIAGRQSSDSGHSSDETVRLSSSPEETNCFPHGRAVTEADFWACSHLELGISERKSLLKSLSERSTAFGAVELAAWGSSTDCDAPEACCWNSITSPLAGRRSISLSETCNWGASPADCSDSDSEEHGLLVPFSSLQRKRCVSSGRLCEREAAAELFFRLKHARQTMAFVRKQALLFSGLDKADLGVWEALEMLGELPAWNAGLDTPSSGAAIRNHTFQTAEACRLAHPSADWLHLTGLLHSLGQLLAHPRISALSQWAISGESYPVGCRFDPGIAFSHFFSVNPDRRCRLYSSACGAYVEGGGLGSVHMSWSGAEYLYMLLLLNQTRLPPEALFVIRHQNFSTLEHSRTYQALMSETDRQCLPWLLEFRRIADVKRQKPAEGFLDGKAARAYYSQLIEKYIPGGRLRF